MANSDVIKTAHTVTTVLGVINQFTTIANVSYDVMLDTTLNKKYGVLDTVKPTVKPTIRYFGIGINGYYNVDTDKLSQAYTPQFSEMDLYNPIPFRVVPVNSDLTASERAKYRMRERRSINGIEYYLYWLKVIDFGNPSKVSVNVVNPTTGEVTPYDFDPETNLTPTPIKLDTSSVVDSSKSRVVVSLSGTCEVTGAEIAEAIDILYGGDYRLARISEYGYYTGEDVSTGSGSSAYTEAAYVQLAQKLCNLGIDLSDPSSVHTERAAFESYNDVIL